MKKKIKKIGSKDFWLVGITTRDKRIGILKDKINELVERKNEKES